MDRVLEKALLLPSIAAARAIMSGGQRGMHSLVCRPYLTVWGNQFKRGSISHELGDSEDAKGGAIQLLMRIYDNRV